MQIVDVLEAGTDLEYELPDETIETYSTWIDYRALAEDGEHTVRIAFGTRPAYGRERKRVVAWVDWRLYVEFVGADDYPTTGEVLSEVRLGEDTQEHMCRYGEEAVPQRYMMFDCVGLRNRISGPGVHNAWAVVANVTDHGTMAALAALRRMERTP
jgi:hypothetical protein